MFSGASHVKVNIYYSSSSSPVPSVLAKPLNFDLQFGRNPFLTGEQYIGDSHHNMLQALFDLIPSRLKSISLNI